MITLSCPHTPSIGEADTVGNGEHWLLRGCVICCEQVREGEVSVECTDDSTGLAFTIQPSGWMTGPHGFSGTETHRTDRITVIPPCPRCGWQYAPDLLIAYVEGRMTLDPQPTHLCDPQPGRVVHVSGE